MKKIVAACTLVSLGFGFGLGWLLGINHQRPGVQNTELDDVGMSDRLATFQADAKSKALTSNALRGDSEAARLIAPLYGKASPDYAAFWERIGAENGDPISQYNYGVRLLDSSQGKASSYVRLRAIFWLQQAANSGDNDAKQRLAELM